MKESNEKTGSKKVNGGKPNLLSFEDIEDIHGANIKWVSENKFEFYVEDDDGFLTNEKRTGIVRSLSEKQRKRANEKLKEIYGPEANFNPNKIAEIWGTEPDKIVNFCHYVVSMQNPHITIDDLESLSQGALSGILLKISRASNSLGFRVEELSFLSGSPTQSTQIGIVANVESKDLTVKETATEK